MNMAIPVKRLNHAVLYVSDLDRSVRFYQDLFGFELVARVGEKGCDPKLKRRPFPVP
jgi:catechol 2,3-dioxygenase-like lactoylglutathione lyase family enzyme